MTKPSTKKVAECIMNECMGFGFEGIFPRSSQEAGPVAKVGDVQAFPLTFHRARGYPKMYRITVQEIT